jgi:hypothetical protein
MHGMQWRGSAQERTEEAVFNNEKTLSKVIALDDEDAEAEDIVMTNPETNELNTKTCSPEGIPTRQLRMLSPLSFMLMFCIYGLHGMVIRATVVSRN